MKKMIVLLFTAAALFAANHTVTLNWNDTLNPAGTTYTVYRSTGLCSGSPAFSKLATGVAEKTYIDATVIPGNYCYYVTATANGIESAPSNSSLGPVPSFAPQMLSVNVQ
jgi:hypothetical protein